MASGVGTGAGKHVSSSNVQSGQLLNSFLSTYNKMKGGTGTGGLGSLSARKDPADSQMKIIREDRGEEESAGHAEELKKR